MVRECRYIFEKHALCLVTNRKATGKEIHDFLKALKKEVKKNMI